MNDRTKAPLIEQDPEEITKVISKMNLSSGKKGSIRRKTYTLSNGISVDSYQMNDWDYKKPNLPTYARGLFTRSVNGKHEIIVRGYDKFFNIDEINETKWSRIKEDTVGPYELSLKENGCIIFIAGLDDKTLIITSKHSTGPREGASANHALEGEKWMDKQLKAMGKTRADLAKCLRKMNATAVAELCDDSFEEHVIEYTEKDAGLYLHGINLNLPQFVTYPGNLVAEFADEWGFKKTTFLVEDSIDKVREFLYKVAETGNYNDRDTEGFVIRCQRRNSPDSPYHDWFFKFKFEEPYLMYRQWREVTKSIIAGRAPRYNKHKKITEEYIAYARKELAKDPSIGNAFNHNHGIIKMRNGFLESKGMSGDQIIRKEEDGKSEDN